jgi:hypothetical protein
MLVEAQLARGRTLPAVGGFREIAAFVEHAAPAEAVLYDGQHNGVFTFHVRAGDPEYRRQVVRGDKLFPSASSREVDADAYEATLVACGCRWLVIEFGTSSEGTARARSLRQVLGGSAFRRVRSFPIADAGASVERVDVYQVLEPRRQCGEVLLTIEVPGAPGPETVEPIRR